MGQYSISTTLGLEVVCVKSTSIVVIHLHGLYMPDYSQSAARTYIEPQSGENIRHATPIEPV